MRLREQMQRNGHSTAPGVVPVELRAAGALVALELGQLVAAAALLAEALQLALPHEGRQPNVHVADAVAEVVGAELAHIAGAVLDLHGMNELTRAAYIRQSAAVYRLQQPVVERPALRCLAGALGEGVAALVHAAAASFASPGTVNGRAVVCDLLGLGD